MLTMLVLVPFITISLIILIIVGLRFDKNERGGDLMRHIYVYLVLFATLMMVIGGSIGVFVSLADIVAPAPYHESFEEFKQWRYDENNEKVEKMSEEELRKKYELMVENTKEQAHTQSINTLIKSFGWILIPLPVFIYFQQRMLKKE